MDQSICSVIGAVIFTWFVVGLAESIGSAPFILIVAVVVTFVAIDTYQVIKAQLKSGNGDN